MNPTQIDKLKTHPAVLKIYQSLVRLKKENKEYTGLCPFHDEKTPSFKVYQHDGVWLFKCFGCDSSGNIFQFIQKQSDVKFGEAVNQVKDFIDNQDTIQSLQETVERTFKPINKKLQTIPLEKYKKLEDDLDCDSARDWLQSRGITYETAKALHLGYRQSIGVYAGEQNTDIADSGWIVFPCIQDGEVISIKYRSVVRKAFSRAPGMATAIFNTQDIDFLEPIYITEGEADAGILKQAGFRAVGLPNSSTKLTPETKELLLTAESRILAGDDDAAGEDCMNRIWKELGNRTYRLHWPVGMKDANQAFLEHFKGDVDKFREYVEQASLLGRATPMPGVYSLQESLQTNKNNNLADHPLRLRFPWKPIDNMAILLPGSVMSIFATNTKQGKTAFVMNTTLAAAREQNEVVLNYQCELGIDEFSTIVASHVLHKDRNHLTQDDYLVAAKRVQGIQYYIGRDPTLTTVNPVLDLIEAAIVRFGATLVVLDHLHFICRNEQNEAQAQANAMQRIKNMAVKYGVKFIVVGQPRKAMQQNKGKLVHITDWKGSESGVSDADAIFAIHRDYIKVKDPNNPPKDDYDPKTEIHLLGCRSKGDGATMATLYFHGAFASFFEQSFETPPPELVATAK